MTTQTKTTWRKVRLKEVLEKVIDNRGKTPLLSNSGYPIIEVFQLSRDRKYPDISDNKKQKFVSEQRFNTWFRSGHPQGGDILMSTVGTIAQWNLMPKNEKYCIAQNVVALRPNLSKTTPEFLRFYFNQRKFISQVKGIVIGATQPSVRLPHFLNLEVEIPPLNTQKRIADILSAFDDKIELNNKISWTLEQMAQAIFKEWLFKNQKSKIKNQKLGDLMVLRKEKFKKYEDWKNLKLLDLGRFPQKSLAITSYGKGEEIKTAGIKFKKGDILFGAVRPYFHKVVIASFDGVTNSSVFVIIPKKDNYYPLLITILFSENTVNYASMSASGTKMPVIKWEVLCDMEISLPEERALNNFNKIVGNFYKVILKNAEENQKLAALRDLLLPRLMSGEIKV